MTDTPAAIDYIERWRQIVAARREQHDAACAAQGRTTDDYWARRAESYREFAREVSAHGDPFVDCLERHLEPDDTVLDVGAGTGRHALPLARRARLVTAVDPSAAMLRFLREDAESQGLSNVEVVEGAWPDAASEAPQADIVISAHVLYPIEEVVAFLRALDGRARRLCFLHLMVWQPWFDHAGLWQAAHGEARRPQPTHIDAVNVLQQLGCHANVEIAWSEHARSFTDVDEAVDGFAESLAIGEDAGRRERVRDALAELLATAADGRLLWPVRRYPLATVWWEAGALR